MKKNLIFLGLMLAATFTLTNCTQEIVNPEEEYNDVVTPSESYPYEITASTVDTKTVIDGFKTSWTEGDKINLFHAVGETDDYKNNGAFTVKDVEEGVFTGNLCESLDSQEEYDWYALYPYNANVTTPAEQSEGYTYIGYKPGLNQTGYNSTASLKGSVCPLYGVLTAHPAASTPSMTMNHLAAVVEINVTNKNDEPLTVTTASLTAEEDLVGSYYIDITKSPVAYTPSEDTYVSKIATVNVKDGTALAKNQSATLYLAIKPFTAKAGQKLTLSVNGYSKEITMSKDVTFTAGKVKTLNFAYDFVAEPEPEGTETYSWDLTKASYASASATEVKWESDYVNMVLTKGSSTTNANNYLGGTNAHTRVYKDQVLTFTSSNGVLVQSVEFNVVSSYMDEFEGATWTNATATTSGLVRKVVPTDASKDFSVKIGSATRFNTVTVYYVLDGNYVPPTLESIKVKNAKTEYFIGDTFVEPDVFAVYDNGNEHKVNEDVTFSGFDSSAAAEAQVVTVTYEGKTCTYTVTISKKQESGDGDSTEEAIWHAENWSNCPATTSEYGSNSFVGDLGKWLYTGCSSYDAAQFKTGKSLALGKTADNSSITSPTFANGIKGIKFNYFANNTARKVVVKIYENGNVVKTETITPTAKNALGSAEISVETSGQTYVTFTPGSTDRRVSVGDIQVKY